MLLRISEYFQALAQQWPCLLAALMLLTQLRIAACSLESAKLV
jgi:hypothetical protein